MKEYEERLVITPDSLIYYPCEPVGPGRTVQSLQKAYVENTYCIGEYKDVLDGIAIYNKKMGAGKDGKQK